jgi:hypothetical protein
VLKGYGVDFRLSVSVRHDVAQAGTRRGRLCWDTGALHGDATGASPAGTTEPCYRAWQRGVVAR